MNVKTDCVLLLRIFDFDERNERWELKSSSQCYPLDGQKTTHDSLHFVQELYNKT